MMGHPHRLVKAGWGLTEPPVFGYNTQSSHPKDSNHSHITFLMGTAGVKKRSPSAPV